MSDRGKTGNEPRVLSGWQSLVIGALLLCGLTAAAVYALMLGVARGHEISYSEIRAASRLRGLCMGQMVFAAELVVDQDGDGKGEYGWMAEVAAAAPPRGRTEPLESAVVHRPLGNTGPHDGVVLHEGYCYVLYLPDGQGNWTRETATVPALDPALADAQETDFRGYAWPAERGRTGWRCFAIDSTGTLRATSMDDPSAFSGVGDPPPADKAFSSTTSWKTED